ncbi:unnamed protein product [Plutella xylostella]|uniref:(diamondback moth) hypothetical protein n=1 Tax=Plutella xylostella TaxID=51655 RepID=A0A8S4DA06_PLUXY|nr:unnamed protein product [Plutella xylostella]
MAGDSAAETPSEDTLKILIATDIHLGHLENDPERGGDSFLAFEEVLATAAEAQADLVLLGGDLFDHARPSPAAMLRATQLLRRYCLGDRPVALELLSDDTEAFGRPVNYRDPDLNVSLPLLTIHGNHDDPVGQQAVSSLDILSSMGLVNYFGRWSDYTQVSVAPVLLRKGATSLALYGLSHLKDQRLSRLFKEGKVEMQRPPGEDWFNMLVLHQNRADRGPGNYIQEEALPGFLDLVVWGHEHDCRVVEEQNITRGFFVTQPGSTVATSLAAGEALPKHCALLQVHRKKFLLTPVPLRTVRPFIFKTIVLSEEELGDASVNENEKVQEFLKAKVYEAVAEAAARRSGDPRQPQRPLVRLSVFFERDNQDFNRVRFGQNFTDVVANPGDLLVMKREARVREKRERAAHDEPPLPAAGAAPDVEALLHDYFASLPPERQLGLLSARALTDAVRDFTVKRDDDSFRAVLRAHRRRALDALTAAGVETEAEVAELMRGCRLELDAAEPAARRELVRKAAATPSPRAEPLAQPRVTLTRTLPPVRAVPPPAHRGARRGGGGGGGVVVLSSDDDSAPEAAPAGRGAGAGEGGGGGAAGAPRAPPRPRRSAAPRAPPPRPPSAAAPRAAPPLRSPHPGCRT